MGRGCSSLSWIRCSTLAALLVPAGPIWELSLDHFPLILILVLLLGVFLSHGEAGAADDPKAVAQEEFDEIKLVLIKQRGEPILNISVVAVTVSQWLSVRSWACCLSIWVSSCACHTLI